MRISGISIYTVTVLVWNCPGLVDGSPLDDQSGDSQGLLEAHRPLMAQRGAQ
jgi:hypothetical protein